MSQRFYRTRQRSAVPYLLLLVCLIGFQTSFTQIIITYAGNGHNGETGDGGPATSAGVVYPEDICLDASGNLYIAGTNKVRKVDAASGIITTVAGNGDYGYSGDGGPATSASLQFTSGVAVDARGNLYITEYSGHRIRKVAAATEIITTIAGTGIAGFSGDGGLAVSAQINTPQSIAVDGTGNVYFADSYNSRVRKIDAATGVITTVAGTGSTSYSGDNGPAVQAGVPYPVSVALDTKGSLYIDEVNNSNTCRVRKVNLATGVITTIAGKSSYAHDGDGGPATAASLFDPSGVCVDNEGNVYISQYDDSRVRKVDAATGIINTVAGYGRHGFGGDCGEARAAELYNPKGIAVDATGNLYIADKTNHRVRKVVASLNTTPSNTNLTICENMLPYEWNGRSLTSAGTYPTVLKRQGVNCDSIAILTLTVSASLISYESVTVCSNLLPYQWQGRSLATAGQYKDTLRAMNGCDSIVVLDLGVSSLALTATATNTTCGTAGGSATVVATGAAPYTYRWNTTPVQETATATGLVAGSYTVTVMDAAGCSNTATVTVDVASTGQVPVLNCPSPFISCVNASGRYAIPKLTTSSSCGIASIAYQVTGATTREGTGDDASGSFNSGVSTITWTVKDNYNNISTCQARVEIQDPFSFEIPDVKVVEKGAANTVYLGFDRATVLTLQARVAGVGGNYTYLWSTGETTSSINVSPSANVTYTVTATNSAGCSKTASKTVSVVDVRCANTPKNVMVCQVTNGYPHNEVQLCVDQNAVDALLAGGAYLGRCGAPAPELSAMVFQNPSRGEFSITV